MNRNHAPSRRVVALAILTVGLLGIAPDARAVDQNYGFIGYINGINPIDPNLPAVPQDTLDRLSDLGVFVGEPMTGYMAIDPNAAGVVGIGTTYQASDIVYQVGRWGDFTFAGMSNPSTTLINNCPSFICQTTASVDAWLIGGDNDHDDDPNTPGIPPTTEPVGFTHISNLTGASSTDLSVLPNQDLPATAPPYFPLPNDADSQAGWVIDFTDTTNGFGVRLGGTVTAFSDDAEAPPAMEVPILPPLGGIALVLGLAAIAGRGRGTRPTGG